MWFRYSSTALVIAADVPRELSKIRSECSMVHIGMPSSSVIYEAYEEAFEPVGYSLLLPE